MEDWLRKFKEHSVGGFHINLSPNMMQCLFLTHYKPEAHNVSDWLVGLKALRARGMVTWAEGVGWNMTKAGIYVIRLIELAGVFSKEDIPQPEHSKTYNWKKPE